MSTAGSTSLLVSGLRRHGADIESMKSGLRNFILAVAISGGLGLPVTTAHAAPVEYPETRVAEVEAAGKKPKVHLLRFRPFATRGEWCLPNIEQAPTATGIQSRSEKGKGKWKYVGYRIEESNYGVHAYTPDVKQINLSFRLVRTASIGKDGKYKIVEIWNFPKSSGY